ncbi:hypothetical protein B0H14DRAFT_2633942 [Mycena olivaceomarginata]|nr:hypothetical protein B0H14DRAFT_2633942 [Mycena olivaceomarginata]
MPVATTVGLQTAAKFKTNFAFTRSLGFEGGKVELRNQVHEALRRLLEILVPCPQWAVLPTQYRAHVLCRPRQNMGLTSPNLLAQWYQPCREDLHPGCRTWYHPISAGRTDLLHRYPDLRNLLPVINASTGPDVAVASDPPSPSAPNSIPMLFLDDYHDKLRKETGFNTKLSGEVYLEYIGMWANQSWEIGHPISYPNRIVYVRSRGVPVDMDEYLDTLY